MFFSSSYLASSIFSSLLSSSRMPVASTIGVSSAGPTISANTLVIQRGGHQLWSFVFQFALCIRSYRVLRCVSHRWSALANAAISWEGSVVNLTSVVVPHGCMIQFSILWSLVDCIVIHFLNLAFASSLLRKPFILRSAWMRRRGENEGDGWHRLRVCLNVHICVCMSEWPVFPTVVLRLALSTFDHSPLQTTAFSLGWCTARSPTQLARVLCGENMSAGDESVHACMLHFPDVCSHQLYPRAQLQLEYIRGNVDMGIDRSRVVEMSSPFHYTDDFQLMLEMNISANTIDIRVDQDAPVRTISYFTEANAPPALDVDEPQWRFFMCSHTWFPPRVHGELMDVKTT